MDDIKLPLLKGSLSNIEASSSQSQDSSQDDMEVDGSQVIRV